MTFEQYWAIVAKQWKLILSCFVVVGLGVFIVSKLTTPLYQSSVLVEIAIQIGSSQADYNNLLASDQLVQTEAQLATGDPVLRAVAAHYSGLTAQQLAGEVSSTTKINTQLFEIDVLDASPKRAADLANDVAQTLIKQQLQVVQQNNSLAQQQLQQDLTTTQQEIGTVSNQIAGLQAKGGNHTRIAALQAQLSGLQQHYNQWETALAQLELTQAQGGNFLRVVQPAQPAVRPARPDVMLNTAAGLVAGLFLGILLAVLFENLDTRVRSTEALGELLGLPLLATIWRASSHNREDVINPTGHNANNEAYRILRTNIGFSGIDKPLRSLMITSAVPRDGKSVVAANLAIFMAKAGKNTLLIDADLRLPTLHDKFDFPGDKMGLSNAILAFSAATAPQPSPQSAAYSGSLLRQPGVITAASLTLDPFVHSVGVPNLRFMPSGPLPPNPSELLDSKAMDRLFKAVESYGVEVVIFDTPPILGLSDASILASKVDGVLVVADINRANKKNLKQVKAILTQAGARVVGCVANKQRQGRHDKSYSYYYYYQHGGEQKREGGQSNGNVHVSEAPTTPVSVFNAVQKR
ncbi:MAG TPA: Wzz/FepE/Etk N-terminal domain-containing protein [Ktedonobacteraceae bacterium]|nr:Wzz/FepE/Etk N-terminal domain-containing protein [Ktedonobacteraceae bacterium]